MSIINLVLQLTGNFHEGDLSLKSGYLYVVSVRSLSQTWALYCLVLFCECSAAALFPPFGRGLSIADNPLPFVPETASVQTTRRRSCSHRSGYPLGPKINLPAWLFCMSWCANFVFRVMQPFPKFMAIKLVN